MVGKAPNKRINTVPTREAILQVAEQLCAEGGVEQIKIRSIARLVGIQAPSIMKHFKNRDAILEEIVSTGLDDINNCYDELIASRPDEKIEELTQKIIGIFKQRPGFMRLALADFAKPGGEKAIEANLEKIDRLDKKEQAIIDEGVKLKLFRKMDASHFSETRIILICGLLAVTEFDEDKSKVQHQIVENLLRYIKAD